MGLNAILFSLLALSISQSASHPLFNPYFRYYGYPQSSYYSGIQRFGFQPYPYFGYHFLPSVPLLEETSYTLDSKLSMVPMMVVPENKLNMISSGHITEISKQKPMVTVQTSNNNVLQCTPAVRIVLERPLVVYESTSSVLFPTEVTVLHENLRLPIHIGALIVPVVPNVYITPQTPLLVDVVYAIPTKPLDMPAQPDYVNNDDVTVDVDAQSVSVESNEGNKKVTILNFPDRVADPGNLVYQPTDEEGELINRNPPQVVIPAGIVQSTQPEAMDTLFTNAKESELLNELREQAKKNRLK